MQTHVKRILLISNKVFHYRVSNYNFFSKRFREEGWDFCVRANELQKNNPYPLDFDFAAVPFRFREYQREVERLRPGVVIFFLHLKDPVFWPLLLWLKWKRIPVVYWNKGVNLEVRHRIVRNLPFHLVHSLVDAIILYSGNEVADIKPNNRQKVWVANNTINFNAFPAIPESKEAIKAEFGIPYEKVVLFVGRMRAVKKVEHLLAIFNELHEPGYGCVIVGEQKDCDLDALIQSPNIRYLGEVFDAEGKQISKLFKMADVFVIPGDVGLGINQAFFWGLPVVTEQGLQPPEIHYLKNGHNGYIVPENDIAELRAKTLLLLKDDALRAEFSRNAREDILREGSIEGMFQGFKACVSALDERRQHVARQTSSGVGDRQGKVTLRGLKIDESCTPDEWTLPSLRTQKMRTVLARFVEWLNRFGEISQDHQDFYGSKVGRKAKSLYYKRRHLGTLAVAPMVFCEAFLPWTRRWFAPPNRLPIADAHFAMGFAFLYEATQDRRHLERAIHFLNVLKDVRCRRHANYAWGYPFDWQTQNGRTRAGTPLITTTPYCYEAFSTVRYFDANPEWLEIMRSTAQHVLQDYADYETRPGAASCSYTPETEPGVVNASAYRAAMLFQAYEAFGETAYYDVAERNLAFVLDSQNEDGSWPYAMDGKRTFIDHFHTCFVLKSLAKAERITVNPEATRAIERGVSYYVEQLFDAEGLPKPFSRRPRMTTYRRELYDCAECLNLGVLLQGRFPVLDTLTERTLTEILDNWVLPTGAFRSRKLLFGWDNVPMHRWGQSQMFRSLALILAKRTQPVSLVESVA